MIVRREVLRTAAVTVATLLSGCAFIFGMKDDTVSVHLANNGTTTSEVGVQLEYDGDSLIDRSVTLEPKLDVEEQFQNPDESGTATLMVSTSSGGSLERDVTVGRGSGLTSIGITIEESGFISVSVGVL